MIRENLFENINKISLTNDQINQVILIVDTGPHFLDKITLENINQIINIGEKNLKQSRENTNNNSLLNKTPAKILEEIRGRNSKSHAIQCSVNGDVDFSFLQNILNNLQPTNDVAEDYTFIMNFLSRHTNMKSLLTKLYKIDIVRRIGIQKKDDRFFKKQEQQYINILNEVKKSLDEFETENQQRLQNHPEINRTLIILKNILNNINYNALPKKFYSVICQKYSDLIFHDFETFNEKELVEKINKL